MIFERSFRSLRVSKTSRLFLYITRRKKVLQLFVSLLESVRVSIGDLVVRRFSSHSIVFVSVVGVVLSL